MKIQYLGHSCFKLTESTGTTIVTDPYKGIGYDLPKGLTADAVTVSHGHFDHNNVGAIGGRPRIIDKDASMNCRAWKSRESEAITTMKVAGREEKISYINSAWTDWKYAIWAIWARSALRSFWRCCFPCISFLFLSVELIR